MGLPVDHGTPQADRNPGNGAAGGKPAWLTKAAAGDRGGCGLPVDHGTPQADRNPGNGAAGGKPAWLTKAAAGDRGGWGSLWITGRRRRTVIRVMERPEENRRG